MNIILTGVKIQQDAKTLSFRKNNLVDVINITVDTDESWEYKLDVEYPVNRTTGQKLYNVIDLVRNGNVCSVVLTAEMLPFNGKYIMQLRGISSDKVYHTDTFEVWVKYSIDVGDVYNPVPSEFYQIEDNITEMNNHPPYPGDNGKWMIWDVDKHEYVESDIDVVGGGGGDYQTKDNLTTSVTAESTNEQYPSAKATYEYGQSIAESAGKIDAITVNGTTQTVEDKTAKIIVNKSTVGLGNVNNTSDNDKPVSSAQASAIADAKQAGTTAQANLDAHIDNKENPHEVTKAQVGLSDVDNTSDENKPVSMLQAIAIADAKKAGTDAQANLTVHINDKENPHEVTKAQIGLGNVNNTSDANKPISIATQNALNGKLDKTAVVDVTVEALKGQAADAKSVYDTIQALPAAADPSLGITGAQAGQIAKITAVDASGVPTAWSPVDMPSGGGETWETINVITLSDAVNTVAINQDSGGNAIALKKVRILVVGSATANQDLFLNNSRYIRANVVGPAASVGALSAEPFCGKMYCFAVTNISANYASISQLANIFSEEITITEIKLIVNNSGTFSAGTKFTIQGVRA